MASINVGDPVPEISAETQDGGRFALSDFRGKQVVVLFFYPGDGTPVCTAEACAFRDSYEDFAKAGAVVIGISGDSNDSHRKFAADHRLPFLLASDPQGEVRKALGVPKTLGLFPGRVTYVIDKQGIVRLMFSSPFGASRHVTEALQVVKQLAGEQT
jgi:thioredoxin-dependent peroxiredoxin